MPQPAALDTLQEPLLDSYRRAWERVTWEQQMLELNPLAYRRKLRLTEMRRTIEMEMDALDANAAEWIAQQLPQVYASGMYSAPDGDTTWSQIHREAVEELSAELFTELLQATNGVRQSTKELVRTVARDQALQKAIEGRTAQQAADEMRRILGTKGIHAVTYSDGSKHGLAEYAQMAMRTTTAKAYNAGTLNAHTDVKFFEIFDGPSCGLTRHDDPQLALGMVVGRDVCEKYPISHPNCRRSFGPRPDIEDAKQAEAASATTTPEQRRAQLEQDAARGDKEAQAVLDRSDAREARLAKRQEKLGGRGEESTAPDYKPARVQDDIEAAPLDDLPAPPKALDTEEDAALREILRRQGMDGGPQVLDPDSFDQTTAGWKKSYRGFREADEAEFNSRFDSFLGQDVPPGRGVYGNGHYFAADRADVERSYAGATGQIVELAMRPDARVIKHEDLQAKLFPLLSKRPDKVDQLSDMGRLAAALGYDAIEVARDAGDYLVVLNRSAFAIKAREAPNPRLAARQAKLAARKAELRRGPTSA